MGALDLKNASKIIEKNAYEILGDDFNNDNCNINDFNNINKSELSLKDDDINMRNIDNIDNIGLKELDNDDVNNKNVVNKNKDNIIADFSLPMENHNLNIPDVKVLTPKYTTAP